MFEAKDFRPTSFALLSVHPKSAVLGGIVVGVTKDGILTKTLDSQSLVTWEELHRLRRLAEEGGWDAQTYDFKSIPWVDPLEACPTNP
jgi:hypothetical protein